MARALVLAAGLAAVALPALSQNCASPQTQTDMNICADREYKIADAALNSAYRRAVAVMRQEDAALNQDQRGAVEALRQAERAWIAYRDAACTSEAYLYHGGTIAPMIFSGCKTRLTRQRTRDLLTLGQQQ